MILQFSGKRTSYLIKDADLVDYPPCKDFNKLRFRGSMVQI